MSDSHSEPRRENRRSRFGTGWRADRRWQAGFLLGSAIGAAATVLGRRAERIARRGLVDWGTVERVAIRRAEKAPGKLSWRYCAHGCRPGQGPPSKAQPPAAVMKPGVSSASLRRHVAGMEALRPIQHWSWR